MAITGANGFLGSHIVDACMGQGHEVVGVVRPGRALHRTDVPVAEAGLDSVDDLRRAFEGADVVVSNAALGGRTQESWASYLATNVKGASAVAIAASKARVNRLVHVSSVAVVRTKLNCLNALDTPTLTDPGLPFTWNFASSGWRYAMSKARGEAAVRRVCADHGLDLVVVRPGPIFGPRDPKLSERYRRQLAQRWLFAPTVRVPHGHVVDIAMAIAQATVVQAAVGRTYFLCGPLASPHAVLQAAAQRRPPAARPRVLPLPAPVWVSWDDAPAQEDLAFRGRSVLDVLDLLTN